MDDKKLKKKQKQEANQGLIVSDTTIGNTRIKINDAYCRDCTSSDIQAILARISRKAQKQLTSQATYAQIKDYAIIDKR